MKSRRLPALLIGLAAAATMAAPAPSPAPTAAPTPSSTVAPQSGRRAEQAAPPAQAVRVSPSRAQFIPLVNMPYAPRREPIWLGRPRDRGGMPWGSRHRV